MEQGFSKILNPKQLYRILASLCCLLLLSGQGRAQWNNPYPDAKSGEAAYYGRFRERPKHLDPAKAYSSDEYLLICHIYEPVVQYHYLKRPYQLEPLTAQVMPEVRYTNASGEVLPPDAPSAEVARAVWTIRLKPGILYQEHPCFARDDQGAFLYHHLNPDRIRDVSTLFDFPQTGTRELTAADYVYQIKRMADPRSRSPIFATVLSEYIVGLGAFSNRLQETLEQTRLHRETKAREAGVFWFNQESDEKQNPIVLDYHGLDCEGLRVIDDATFEIVLNRKYPQFLYWLAMPFFSPMPWEAIHFFEQGLLRERNIVLDWYPVGTGPFRLAAYNPNFRIEMIKNENFRKETYPSVGDVDDLALGLLADAGQTLPLIQRLVFTRELEASPAWLKFKQGYYDVSGIATDNFFEVMDFSTGSARLQGGVADQGIRLVKSVDTTIFYTGFNMEDPVVGGLDERSRKLRQALSIAIDREAFIQIFMKGRGIPAQGPLPPGIFGNREGQEGMNPYVYNWNESIKRMERKSLEEARALLAEAGYRGGFDAGSGEPLVLFYDTVASPGNAAVKDWLTKQYASLGIRLEIRETDYNRFREKMNTGNYQIFSWGWNADYPDPENFLFLLYGPNGKTRYQGENTANYQNPQFDRLFERMATMTDTPERLALIDEMLAILRRDAPWEFGLHPESYVLYHGWVRNVKPHKMANNPLKYYFIDAEARTRYQGRENQPLKWPVVLTVGLAVALGAWILRVLYPRRESA